MLFIFVKDTSTIIMKAESVNRWTKCEISGRLSWKRSSGDLLRTIKIPTSVFFVLTNELIKREWSTLLYNNQHIYIGNYVAQLLWKYKWEFCAHIPAIQSKYESTRFWLIPRVEIAHAWIPFFLPRRAFCSSYLNHPNCIKVVISIEEWQSFRSVDTRSWKSRGLRGSIIKEIMQTLSCKIVCIIYEIAHL